jgi:hypothetical protein
VRGDEGRSGFRQKVMALTSTPLSIQKPLHDARLQAPVPHVGNVPRKEPPCVCPVGAIVVGDGAELARTPIDASAGAPCRVIVHAIRRVRHHQQRPRSIEQACDIGRIGAVATEDAVRPEGKEIATLNRGRPFVRKGVGIGQSAMRRGLDVGEDLAQFLLGPEMRKDVRGLRLEVVKALGVPRGQFCRAIVGEREPKPLFGRHPALHDHERVAVGLDHGSVCGSRPGSRLPTRLRPQSLRRLGQRESSGRRRRWPSSPRSRRGCAACAGARSADRA